LETKWNGAIHNTQSNDLMHAIIISKFSVVMRIIWRKTEDKTYKNLY